MTNQCFFFFHLVPSAVHPEDQQYQCEENCTHETRPLCCFSCMLGHPCCRNQCQIRILHSRESVSTMTPVKNTSTSAAEKGNKIPSCTWGDFFFFLKCGKRAGSLFQWQHLSGFKNTQYICSKEVIKFVSFPVWCNAKVSWSTNQQQISELTVVLDMNWSAQSCETGARTKINQCNAGQWDA